MLNGSTFAQMTVSAANHLENHRDEIDAMNVFPVPDGDTGKNMSLTMRGAANAAEASDMLPLDETVQKVATGMLKSARGNSGVILSQLVRGMAKGMEHKKEVRAADMGRYHARSSEICLWRGDETDGRHHPDRVQSGGNGRIACGTR